MTKPQLTFFCELDAESISELFSNHEINQILKELKAGVSIGLLDLSAERVEVVREFNGHGIPVTAWLLLPKEQGYWPNAFNVDVLIEFYHSFVQWSRENELNFIGVGLDIEPDINDIRLIAERKIGSIFHFIKRLPNYNRIRRSEIKYQWLINQIHSDGFIVETYQIPIIVDEINARSTLIRRITGLVSLNSDCDVLMLYSSLTRPYGTGLIGSYAPEADAVGIGSSGGGVEIGIDLGMPITWDELSRDLRLAWYWTDRIYIFSLEGCVRNNYLEKLLSFNWDQPYLLPVSNIAKINRVRSFLWSVLWLSSHLWKILVTGFGILLMIRLVNKRNKPS